MKAALVSFSRLGYGLFMIKNRGNYGYNVIFDSENGVIYTENNKKSLAAARLFVMKSIFYKLLYVLKNPNIDENDDKNKQCWT